VVFEKMLPLATIEIEAFARSEELPSEPPSSHLAFEKSVALAHHYAHQPPHYFPVRMRLLHPPNGFPLHPDPGINCKLHSFVRRAALLGNDKGNGGAIQRR
jgi:hypothetical protein